MIVRKASFDMGAHHDKRADQVYVVVIHAFGAVVTRFLINKMDTVAGAVGVILAQAAVELVLRQTITLRDRFVFVHVLRRSPAEADARFGSVGYGRHRARVVLGEMVSEYACIVLAPALVLLFEHAPVGGAPLRRWMNLGWRSDGAPVNAVVLLLGALLQLGAELVVDVLCVRGEERLGIPVLEEWRRAAAAATTKKKTGTTKTKKKKKKGRGPRRVIYLWHLAIAVSVAGHMLLDSFQTRPPPACQPYPCHQCMAAGGAAGGALLTAGSGANPQLVHWCAQNFPGAGGNATYFCKDAGDVRGDASLGGLTEEQATQCVTR